MTKDYLADGQCTSNLRLNDVFGQGTIVRDGQIETRYERDAIYSTFRFYDPDIGLKGASRVVQIDVLDDIAGKMHKDPHLDGIGPARYAELEDLNNPRSRTAWRKEVDYSGCR
ncbi:MULTISPECIES: hypothetical protein [unclassified Burkholderia]|uniref:hypothetical protein n=1 Tax=unclassified Burkholderia TaxID=2613784 RepID=UPI000F56BA22|nr:MULTISPECIES: hypothetical protein [unclassified Burkholderia]